MVLLGQGSDLSIIGVGIRSYWGIRSGVCVGTGSSDGLAPRRGDTLQLPYILGSAPGMRW